MPRRGVLSSLLERLALANDSVVSESTETPLMSVGFLDTNPDFIPIASVAESFGNSLLRTTPAIFAMLVCILFG
jgi:hypothetical protein